MKCAARRGWRNNTAEVIVVIGAGLIGQAIARRVGAGKHVLLSDVHQANAEAAATVLADAGFDTSTAVISSQSGHLLRALTPEQDKALATAPWPCWSFGLEWHNPTIRQGAADVNRCNQRGIR